MQILGSINQTEPFKEMNDVEYHGVKTLVPRSMARGKKIFKPRVVYKIKTKPPTAEHPRGEIERFRYRLPIAAFTRMLKAGIDYEDKYASTVQWAAIKILIALAVRYNWDIVLIDIKTFFL